MIRETVSYNFPNLSMHIKRIKTTDNKLLKGKHFHKQIELVYVDSGSLLCEVNGETILLNKDNALLINSQSIHQILQNDTVCEFTYLQIDMSDYINAQLPAEYADFATIIYNSQQRYMLSDTQGEVSEIFKKIRFELERNDTFYEIYTKAYISLLLASMYRNNLIFDITKLQKNSISKFLPAIDYIENNFKSKLYLDDICRILNVNKFNFCKDFKKAFGYTFVEYINLRRLAYAQNLLLNSNKTVLEIALESGFASAQYFNKCFKTYKSCTPKSYQKMYR